MGTCQQPEDCLLAENSHTTPVGRARTRPPGRRGCGGGIRPRLVDAIAEQPYSQTTAKSWEGGGLPWILVESLKARKAASVEIFGR